MGKFRKPSQKTITESESGSEIDSDEVLDNISSNDEEEENFVSDDGEEGNTESDDFGDEDGEEAGSYEKNESGDEDDYEEAEQKEVLKNAEMEELENEYRKLQQTEQELLSNLKSHKNEDILKGEAVKNQKALWDKTLEIRILLQKPFSSSNRLPQEPIKSSFCDYGDEISEAYSDLIGSSMKTLESISELQAALLENNPSITQSTDGTDVVEESHQAIGEIDEEWSQIAQMHSRVASFRDKSIDKWQRRTQVTTGVAAVKGKLHAFNQSISQQVSNYMRDPSKTIKGMQLNTSAVAIFGTVPNIDHTATQEGINVDGNPELLYDEDFYQQLLKEFFDSVDPTSSGNTIYPRKRLQTKKVKVVDRRASKSRKIRYNVHEKIVNFMVPEPMDMPPMAPKLFENLFGLRTQSQAS
ncbi:unnamed protein product [Cuscuta epithymum]|uniref:Protein BFR2 n=1 Tax=Cuscuta epithymum TaxID=186058 RepID=A0AAV0G6F8_9ASTE|nr:unnamed protein product [Cuscuta epithymum]